MSIIKPLDCPGVSLLVCIGNMMKTPLPGEVAEAVGVKGLDQCFSNLAAL